MCSQPGHSWGGSPTSEPVPGSAHDPGVPSGWEVRRTALSFENHRRCVGLRTSRAPQQEGSSPLRPVLPESQDSASSGSWGQAGGRTDPRAARVPRHTAGWPVAEGLLWGRPEQHMEAGQPGPSRPAANRRPAPPSVVPNKLQPRGAAAVLQEQTFLMLLNTCYNVAAKQTLLFDVPAAAGAGAEPASAIPRPSPPAPASLSLWLFLSHHYASAGCPCPRLSKHSGPYSWPQPARLPPPTCWLGGCLGPCSTYVASESSGRTA